MKLLFFVCLTGIALYCLNAQQDVQVDQLREFTALENENEQMIEIDQQKKFVREQNGEPESPANGEDEEDEEDEEDGEEEQQS